MRGGIAISGLFSVTSFVENDRSDQVLLYLGILTYSTDLFGASFILSVPGKAKCLTQNHFFFVGNMQAGFKSGVSTNIL